ncbi:MAG: SRPBCC domain-containing protein [Chitinophagaceae bacterium]|jgi:uncharacterized protein YndB with AHSA1/START domain|nr:SRPBCC domain-containing protein [Chitinophagaceae bacterium]
MITIQTRVNVPASHAWTCWTTPAHIMAWNFADPSWHCPAASNNLQPGGNFSFTMAARDGSESFDFKGTYDLVEPGQRIEYTIEDGRKVIITFETDGDAVVITESFDPENMNPPELQQQGWQQILDNFAHYATSCANG